MSRHWHFSALADTPPEKPYLVILMFTNLAWKLIDVYVCLQKSVVYFLKMFMVKYFMCLWYNVLILILLLYYLSMSVADAFMLKLCFEKIYFWEELFVVEAFDQFKISKKQNQNSVYCGGYFMCLSCLCKAPQI